jgi:hypothetical protein
MTLAYHAKSWTHPSQSPPPSIRIKHSLIHSLERTWALPSIRIKNSLINLIKRTWTSLLASAHHNWHFFHHRSALSSFIPLSWHWFVYNKDFTPSKVREWRNISLFELTTLSFYLCLHKCHASLASSSSENLRFEMFKFFNFETPPFEERTNLGKVSLFWRSFFLVNGMDDTTSNLT